MTRRQKIIIWLGFVEQTTQIGFPDADRTVGQDDSRKLPLPDQPCGAAGRVSEQTVNLRCRE